MDSIRDALLQTERGVELVGQVNAVDEVRRVAAEKREEIAGRIRALKEAFHLNCTQFVPVDAYHGSRYVLQQRCWKLFQDAKEPIRQLGVVGGPAYERALSATKFMWSPVGCKYRDGVKKAVYDRDSYDMAVDAIFNGVDSVA